MGEVVKVLDLDLPGGPVISEDMSALLPSKFPSLGEHDATLDPFVTMTPINYSCSSCKSIA